MKKELKGFAAAAQNNIMNDPNWKSPVQREPEMGKPLSMAQYVNQYGVPETPFNVKAEVGGLGWVDAFVANVDTKKDEADPHNMGYWHNSRCLCAYDRMVNGVAQACATWIPFSMILIEAKS